MARADDGDMECRDEDKVRNDSDLDFIDEETSFQDQKPSESAKSSRRHFHERILCLL